MASDERSSRTAHLEGQVQEELKKTINVHKALHGDVAWTKKEAEAVAQTVLGKVLNDEAAGTGESIGSVRDKYPSLQDHVAQLVGQVSWRAASSIEPLSGTTTISSLRKLAGALLSKVEKAASSSAKDDRKMLLTSLTGKVKDLHDVINEREDQAQKLNAKVLETLRAVRNAGVAKNERLRVLQREGIAPAEKRAAWRISRRRRRRWRVHWRGLASNRASWTRKGSIG